MADLEFTIAKLALEPGDVLVVKGPTSPNHDVMTRLVPAGVRVLYIPPDVELSVLTKAAIDARAEPARQGRKASMTVFDPKKPTALFVGRYQPFHVGHKALIEEGLRRVGQACIAVRSTHGIDDKNPLPFEGVKAVIELALEAHAGQFVVVQVPNITDVFYGRDVGYNIERITLDRATEAISATQLREAMRG